MRVNFLSLSSCFLSEIKRQSWAATKFCKNWLKNGIKNCLGKVHRLEVKELQLHISHIKLSANLCIKCEWFYGRKPLYTLQCLYACGLCQSFTDYYPYYRSCLSIVSFFFIAHALTVSVRLVCRRKRLRLRAVRDCILKSSSSFGICFKKVLCSCHCQSWSLGQAKGRVFYFSNSLMKKQTNISWETWVLLLALCRSN